jgi:hypothetical protein
LHPLSPRRHLCAALGEGEGWEGGRRWGEDVVRGGVIGDPCHRRFTGGEWTVVGELRGHEPASASHGGRRARGWPRASSRAQPCPHLRQSVAEEHGGLELRRNKIPCRPQAPTQRDLASAPHPRYPRSRAPPSHPWSSGAPVSLPCNSASDPCGEEARAREKRPALHPFCLLLLEMMFFAWMMHPLWRRQMEECLWDFAILCWSQSKSTSNFKLVVSV